MTIDLTRPIIGIENRTAQEVFDIMSDRIRAHLSALPAGEDGVEQWRAHEYGEPFTGWHVGNQGDRPGWEAIAKRCPEKYAIETRLLVPITSLSARIEALEAESERLREALTPSGDTKAAYSGEIKISITRIDEFGDEQTDKRLLPWTVIKDVMAMIRDRAALSRRATTGGGDRG